MIEFDVSPVQAPSMFPQFGSDPDPGGRHRDFDW
jgi:hypothetical protein